MRLSPGASAPRLRTRVVMRGLRRRARRRSGSGGPGDSRGRSVPRRRGRPCVRQPGAGVFQPNRAVGVRRHGHDGLAAVVQHAADTDGPAQIMRIDRRRIIRSVAKLARTRRSLRRAAAGPAREATMAQQAVAVLVPGCRWTAPTRMRPKATARPRCRHAARASHRRPAGDHCHRGPCEPGPRPAVARAPGGCRSSSGSARPPPARQARRHRPPGPAAPTRSPALLLKPARTSTT
jgi:hypothetical protein